MLVLCDPVEPNCMNGYHLYKLDYSLILRNDVVRSRIRYQLCSFCIWSLICVNFVIVQYNLSTKNVEKLFYKYRSIVLDQQIDHEKPERRISTTAMGDRQRSRCARLPTKRLRRSRHLTSESMLIQRKAWRMGEHDGGSTHGKEYNH